MLKIVSVNDEHKYYPQHLLCKVNVKSDILRKIFGAPTKRFDGKTDWEWIIKFENGKVLYIYDYKIGQSYWGENGLPFEYLNHWSIGGVDSQLAKQLKEFLEDDSWDAYEDIRLKMIFTKEYLDGYHVEDC